MKHKRQTENSIRKCRSCGAPIRFVRSVKFDDELQTYVAGGYIPVQNMLTWGDGFKTLVVIHPVAWKGRVIVGADNETQGYEPHFGYCQGSKVPMKNRPAKQLALSF